MAAIALVLFAFVWSPRKAFSQQSGAGDKETDPAVLAKLEEFQDLKFGLFIHWGPCTQWGTGGRYENYVAPEQEFPDKPLPYPWETCLTMGDYWAYNPNDYYKPARELIDILVEIVCKGGNLLLDIGPDADGRLPATSLDRLKELGDWMKYNGEAIFGTRPIAPYQEGRLRFTRKGDAVYVIHLANLAQIRPRREIAVSCIRPAEGAEVTLLGLDVPLEWEARGKGSVIRIPTKISHRLRGDHPYCRHAWTVKISKAVVEPAE